MVSVQNLEELFINCKLGNFTAQQNRRAAIFKSARIAILEVLIRQQACIYMIS